MGRQPNAKDLEGAVEDACVPLDTARLQLNRVAHLLSVMVLGSLYIACSAGMISFNKYLMSPGKFQFPVYLVILHTGSGTLFAGLLRMAAPSLFVSLTGPPEKRLDVSCELLLKRVFPIALLQVLYLVLSNSAYMHSSVSFLQMMKESNVIFVFILSVIATLETFTSSKAAILFVVLVATTMTIKGELNFSWTGFMLQGSSQGFESLRIVLQSLVLNTGRKLDAFSYTLIMMPCCLFFLTALASVNARVHYFPIPTMTDLHTWGPMLLLNAALAFSLNVTVALFMSRTSAVSMIMAGLIKDAMIVFAGCMLFGDVLSNLQFTGFGLQLVAISLWSTMKMFQDEFSDGLLNGVTRLVAKAQGFNAMTTAKAT